MIKALMKQIAVFAGAVLLIIGEVFFLVSSPGNAWEILSLLVVGCAGGLAQSYLLGLWRKRR